PVQLPGRVFPPFQCRGFFLAMPAVPDATPAVPREEEFARGVLVREYLFYAPRLHVDQVGPAVIIIREEQMFPVGGEGDVAYPHLVLQRPSSREPGMCFPGAQVPQTHAPSD